jgi:hypothetical protein
LDPQPQITFLALRAQNHLEARLPTMNSKGQHYESAHTSSKSHHIGEHSGNVPDHKPYGSSKGWYHHAEGSCGSGGDMKNGKRDAVNGGEEKEMAGEDGKGKENKGV